MLHQLPDRPTRILLCGGDMRLCAIFEDTPVAKHEIDAEGTVVRVNCVECELLGFSAEEMIGKPIWDFVAPWGREKSREAIRRKIRREQALAPIEREYTRRDGTVLVLQIHESYIFDADGTVLGLRSALLDVTERKRHAELLSKQADELARSNAELQQFAYVASHDLQEPLRMVASYTQLLSRRYKGKLDADADEFIAFAVDGASRMQELINDLLAYSRVGTRRGELRSVDSGTVLTKALDSLRFSLEESGAVIAHDALPVVWADAMELGQVFQNLVGNAIKFRNGKQPRIAVAAVECGGMWRFCVQDNGIGIDPKYSERIFQVFQRLHAKEAYPGTGIGLAICKKIVERHGGTMWVESVPGEGASFYFTLSKVQER